MRAATIDDIRLDLDMLEEYESDGISQAEIGERYGLSQSHVSRRLARARRFRARTEAADPDHRPRVNFLLPRNGVPLNEATCDDVHPNGPIRRGSNECCSVGHESGRDHELVGLARDELPAEGGRIYDPPNDGLKGGRS